MDRNKEVAGIEIVLLRLATRAVGSAALLAMGLFAVPAWATCAFSGSDGTDLEHACQRLGRHVPRRLRGRHRVHCGRHRRGDDARDSRRDRLRRGRRRGGDALEGRRAAGCRRRRPHSHSYASYAGRTDDTAGGVAASTVTVATTGSGREHPGR